MIPRRFPVIPEKEWRPLLDAAKPSRVMGPYRVEPRRHDWTLYENHFTADNPRLSFGERMARWAGFTRWGHG